MPATPLSFDAIKAKLASIEEGSQVTIKYERLRAPGTILTRRGTIFKSGSAWVLKVTTTSAMRLPSEHAIVYDIQVTQGTSRSNSRRRHDEFDEEVIASAIPMGEELQEASQFDATQVVVEGGTMTIIGQPNTRRQREDDPTIEQLPERARQHQPRHQEESDLMKQVFTFMKIQQEQHAQQMTTMAKLVETIRQPQQVTAEPPQQQHPQGTQVVPGNDISQLMALGDAIRGTDDPRWRIVPGLLLPKYLIEKFKIVSIPHLLFKEDATTSLMVKLPRGEAIKYYKSILSNSKMAFPNQNAVSTTRPKGKNDHASSGGNFDSSEGLRAQLERAERMFAALLEQLDQQGADNMPSTREQWMPFIDAGAQVLEIYASMAYGFLRGGAKVSVAYNQSITTKGTFDPAKLWPEEGNFRRKSE